MQAIRSGRQTSCATGAVHIWVPDRRSLCSLVRDDGGGVVAVIASEAKQSISLGRERMDCFVASAPRNDKEGSNSIRKRADVHPHSRGMIYPRFILSIVPLDEREQGMPGARCTRGLVCKVAQKKAHTSIQVQRRQSGIPCAMVLRLMPRSPRRRIRLVTVAAGLMADRSGWIKFATDGLAPATGVGTTRFCRTQPAPFVLRAVNRSQAARLALRSPCAPTLPRPPHPSPRS
jgi:hypothetical protein